MGRNLPLGRIDIGHHIAAGLAGEIVNVHIGRRFGGVQHGRAFGVRRAVDQKAAVGADLPVSLPVALIGALFVMGAGDTVAVAAEVIGILAVSVLTVLGTDLAQAALGTDAAIVLFAAIIAVLFRLQFPGAVIAVAAVAGEVSVGAARAAVVAYLKTRAVPAAIALLAAGQFGAA